jgi:hypothetical protein
MKAFYILMFFPLNIILHDDPSDKYSDKKVVEINYNLTSPDKIYVLPGVLKEVSGITEIDPTSIACIQDENGILFIYDLMKEQITKQYSFYFNGDYEGIARVDKAIYILRSDGRLFGITNYESVTSTTESYSTGVPAKNNEGLCYDQNANRLLIAPKNNYEKDSDKKNLRFIYSFDLKSKKLDKDPAFEFDLKVIKKFASENKFKIPKKGGKKGDKNNPDIEFRPSALAIHPFTDRLYVLSGMEKLLFVFNPDGEIEYVESLDPELFVQPEGITFLQNGDMLISNDIKNKKPTILRFNYIKK